MERGLGIPQLRVFSIKNHMGERLQDFIETVANLKSTDGDSVVTLRWYRDDDKPYLIKYFNDANANTLKWLRNRIPIPYTQADADFWVSNNSLEHFKKHQNKFNNGLVLAIEHNGVFVGAIQYSYLSMTDIECRSAELGYWLAREYRSKGIVTRAVNLMMEIIEKLEPRMIRLEARIFAENKASERVLLKSGFEYEGITKHAYWKHGRSHDSSVYYYIFESHLSIDSF